MSLASRFSALFGSSRSDSSDADDGQAAEGATRRAETTDRYPDTETDSQAGETDGTVPAEPADGDADETEADETDAEPVVPDGGAQAAQPLEATAREFRDACEQAAERLDEGFDLINDMRTLKPSDEEAIGETERGKRALANGGMVAAVRLVSESTMGQMRFDRAGEGEESYAVAKAESVEEAERLLDQRRSA